MNTNEAKEKLLLYRGAIDDADPQFSEALAYAHRDPELAEWLRDRHRLIQGREIVVKGEVLDLTCYVAYNWSGPKHASCAMDCIKSGLPVGIKAEDGKVYLLTGKEAHVNDELADYAAKIVTIKGKETAREGFAQIQVEEIRKF